MNFFSLVKDSEEAYQKDLNGKNDLDDSVRSNEIIKNFRKCGFRGKRNITENFMLPHYLYTRRYLQYNNYIKLFIALMNIFLKTIIKIYTTSDNLLEYLAFFSIISTGFNLHFSIILYDFTLNDDLKTKNYMTLALKNLISIK